MNTKSFVPDVKENENVFYKLLHDKLISSDRESFIINNPIIKLNVKNNVTTTYNCSGNVKINCLLPKSDKMFPNYVNVILNSAKVGDENTNLITILTSFITHPSFLATYSYSSNLKSSNDVPIINLSTVLDKLNLCWNWNAGRNFNKDLVRDMSNYYMSKFNELIDYVITTDLVKVDDNFNKLLVSMFANDEGKIFAHSNGSLVLPSLVNWLSINGNDGKNNAMDVCGYVKQGSKVFPTDLNTDWNNVVKWSDKDESVSPIINVPKDFNHSITKSKYNYPFNASYQIPTIIPTPKVSYDYMDGVNIGFQTTENGDKYGYTKTIEEMKKIKYATRMKGSKKTVQTGNPNGRDALTFDLTVGVGDLYKQETVTYPGSYTTRYKMDSSGWWPWCGNYRADTVTLINHSAIKYVYKNDNEIKNMILSKITKEKIVQKSTITKDARTIRDYVVSTFTVPDTYKYNFIDYNVASNTVYKKCTGGYEDRDAGCHWVGYEEGCKNGTVSSFLGLRGLKANTQINITATIVYTYDTSGTAEEYTGTFGKVVGSKTDDKCVCMYETKMDLYFFNDNVFSYWVNIIKNSNNQQLILNEMRKYLKSHLELALMNKINRVVGKYVRNLNSDVGDGSNAGIGFMGIPLGPPLVSIPSSYVINHKNSYPSFKVDNISKIKYDKNSSFVDIINTISCESTNNFLDVWFRSVINSCRNLNSFIDENTYSYFILPSKGYQLFEVIDKSMTTIAPEGLISGYGKLNDTTSMIFNFNAPKCIVSMKDFSSDSKLQTLNSAYKFISSVSIPIFNIKSKNENLEISINTLTDDVKKENVAYIYISSDNTQELISSLKGSGADEKDKNVDKNNINNRMINIQYNGIDSNKTPMCLQLHFI